MGLLLLAPLAQGAPPEVKPEETDEPGETPFTQYGEFNEDTEEADAALFFQYGRFFGVSFGVGFAGATGNRGLLWKGGFPMIAARMHYWFDFNLAMQLEYLTSSFFHDASGTNVDVSWTRLGADIKYYFDTRNLSAPVTFASPYILVGGGVYTRSESNQSEELVDKDNKFGFNAGAGLEFMLSHKKAYLELEGKIHVVSFKDRFSSDYKSSNIPDLTGAFYTIGVHLLFTW